MDLTLHSPSRPCPGGPGQAKALASWACLPWDLLATSPGVRGPHPPGEASPPLPWRSRCALPPNVSRALPHQPGAGGDGALRPGGGRQPAAPHTLQPGLRPPGPADQPDLCVLQRQSHRGEGTRRQIVNPSFEQEGPTPPSPGDLPRYPSRRGHSRFTAGLGAGGPGLPQVAGCWGGHSRKR